MQRVFAILIIAIGAACGRPEPPPPAPAATTPAGADAKARPAAAPALVPPVPPDVLGALLPEIAGWTRESPRVELISEPVAYSKAEAHYRRGDERIELVITDSGFQPVVLAPIQLFLAAGSEEHTGDAVRKTVTIAGAPGTESWTASAGRGEVTALVAGRFIVTAEARFVADLGAARAVVRAVDFHRLAGLR